MHQLNKTEKLALLKFNLATNREKNKMILRLLILTVVIHTGLFCSLLSATENQPIYKRIISLYPAHTENLVALGLTEELIGIAASDTYPPEVLSKPRYSHRDNAEKFIAAAPDLVLVRPMIVHAVPELLKQLRGAGIKVISLQPRSVDEMYDYWMKLGKLAGRESKAKQMVLKFKQELTALEKDIEMIPFDDRPGVYFESIHSKMKTFAPTSIAIFVLEQAGGRNIATDAKARRDTNIAAYGKERILSHADEIDIFLAQQGRMNRVSVEQIVQESGFQAIKAVREGKIFLVDEQLVSRPTQRILEGIRVIKNILCR
jgi:iron complex transport system substrate-binding protein